MTSEEESFKMQNKRLLGDIAILLIVLVLGCIFFAINKRNENVLPKLGIVPNVPSVKTVKLLSFGDEQFYFRILALQIQNSGDSFGRFTALKEYDFEALSRWFLLLDDLDSRSNFIPSLAAYYYSNTQKVEDNTYIVDYLESHYDKDPINKWWWLGQAALISSYKLKDKNRALRLAFKLSNSPAKLPRWAQQMPAIIYAEMGEKELAFKIMNDLYNRFDDYTEQDLNYMNDFIQDRLGYKNRSFRSK